MNALSAQVVQIKTMADQSVRLVLDMHCTLTDLVAMVSGPGDEVAIARLLKNSPTHINTTEQDTQKGGALSKLAGQWENDPIFNAWRLRYYPGAPESFKEHIYEVCEVESRKTLDYEEMAAYQFNTHFRLPYMREARP